MAYMVNKTATHHAAHTFCNETLLLMLRNNLNKFWKLLNPPSILNNSFLNNEGQSVEDYQLNDVC